MCIMIVVKYGELIGNYPLTRQKRRIKMFEVIARYYADPDCFGESFISTSDNGDVDLDLEIGTKVDIIPEKVKNSVELIRQLKSKISRLELEIEAAEAMDTQKKMSCPDYLKDVLTYEASAKQIDEDYFEVKYDFVCQQCNHKFSIKENLPIFKY